ncbi:MAG: methylenetetrahydrofolate--tRNA-(uracil(54)-C(5))-methyltransferase (FADH(2)-oxidizing) TrmFO [Ruminococcaceae bacterium]|nr:methylenetetrahydrofolate--tRNA-(uracil(54)-C(5))-methyltransferase (FADH(2)-oxidizing) TrmFO [Oscillospiraceae bacterium]
MKNNKTVKIIGAGLAGCEAAWQASKLGVDVMLYEMKPKSFSPAHHSEKFAELVCSNSFRSNQLSNAIGLLKEEMHRMGSLVMEAAYACEVPAGSALAVDREKFSDYITDKIKSNTRITVINEEVTQIDADTDEAVVYATGPLTSDSLADSILEFVGGDELHFYDAAAPIVDASTVNYDIAFFASRYGKGSGDDYLNCPMNEEQYNAFYNALLTAEMAKLKEFDSESQQQLQVFEGCMPVEVMAQRGYDVLRFGPMKPVGLPLPSTGKDAFATVQLRKENLEGSMYNIVGFQTHLTFSEQKRVFRMIPGLENAEFFRYGVMHRNTYLNSVKLLNSDYSTRKNPNIFFAGQMTGVEGYIESASSGFVAGINAAMRALNEEIVIFPPQTEIGALASYISNPGVSSFQPMNANFGVIAPLDKKVKGGKSARNEAYAVRSLEIIDEMYRNIKERQDEANESNN